MRGRFPCKRGTLGQRNKWGHCICDLCKAAKKANAKDRSEYHRQWRAANPGKVKAYLDRWLAENPEQRKAIVNAWRKANPSKVAEMNSKAGAKWSRENKGARAAITQSRRAAKLQRTPAWADKGEIKQVYLAAARRSAETGIPHEVDHIYPLRGDTVSGLHVHQNLRVIPRFANRSKGNSLCEF